MVGGECGQCGGTCTCVGTYVCVVMLWDVPT